MKTHVLETYAKAESGLREFIVRKLNSAYGGGTVPVKFSFKGDELVYERTRRFGQADEWAMLRFIMGLAHGYDEPRTPEKTFAPDSWAGCCRASRRIWELVIAMYNHGDPKALAVAPTITCAEIIATELSVNHGTPEKTFTPELVTGLEHALAVMVLDHRIREYLELYDPKAFEQAEAALTAYQPAYAARLAEARINRAESK